jgi:ABC-type branched-subunit amino acid transport system permease subunit
LLGIPALKIKGLYLAMSTVAFAAAFPSLSKLEFFGIPERTGGANGREITEKLNPPDWMPIFDVTEPGRYRYFLIAALALFAFWAVGNLINSRPGRAVISIRDNEIGAAVSGVELRRFKVLNFGLSAAIGGMAGVMWAMNSGFVAEQDFTFVLMVDLLVGLVVGGVATVSGAAIGAIVVVFGRWLVQTYFNYSMSAIIWLIAVVGLAVYLARQQATTQKKIMTAAATVVVGWGVGLALFAAVDIPGLYQLNGDGPLSQAVFGIVLIGFVFFAPQGIVGSWRKMWANFVQVIPVPPALPDGAEILVKDMDALHDSIQN